MTRYKDKVSRSRTDLSLIGLCRNLFRHLPEKRHSRRQNMAFYQITYNEKYNFATLHNWGCTFHCTFCSYKLRGGAESRPGFMTPKPDTFLKTADIKQTLTELQPDTVYFMGGEPSLAKDLDEIIKFAKTSLGAKTKLGHTNGSRIPKDGLDAANVGFKAWTPELHQKITGKPKELIYGNFTDAFESGINMEANFVYIPHLTDLDEMEGLLGYLSELDRNIPFHIMGYIPVPGEPWNRPTNEQMMLAEKLSREYLTNVHSSHLTSNEALDLSSRDDRFMVTVVA